MKAMAWAWGVGLGYYLGCGGDPAASSPETSSPEAGPPESTYDPAHLVEVQVELAPSDWESLRYQGRTLFQLLARAPSDYEYADFDARVTVDGQLYPQAAVRKKGYIGSVSALRPSLRVHLARNGPQLATGLRQLTLNNDRQDPTHARQCLSYELFARAGVPAPRCNLAHVVVNGEDLGVYTNLEPIKKPFLRRHFDDADGQLYEGQSADFTSDDVAQVESDDSADAGDRGDLNRLVAALQASDAELVSTLSQVLDLGQFRDFWALETLLGHWDGYSNNLNNYYAYHDPTTDKFVFIPWGTDQAFEGLAAADVNAGIVGVYAAGRISSRLYGLPEQRVLYRQRLAELNDQLWEPAALLAAVAHWQELAGGIPAESLESLEQLETFLEGHGDVLRAELSGPAREWTERDRAGLPADACTGSMSDAGGSFQTSWGDLDEIDPGAGSFDLTLSLDGSPLDTAVFGGAGHDLGSSDWELRAAADLRFIGPLADGRDLLVQLYLPVPLFRPGKHPLHLLETFGTVGAWDSVSQVYSLLGLISEGSIIIQAAGRSPGASVTGSFTGRFYQLACSTPAPLSL